MTARKRLISVRDGEGLLVTGQATIRARRPAKHIGGRLVLEVTKQPGSRVEVLKRSIDAAPPAQS